MTCFYFRRSGLLSPMKAVRMSFMVWRQLSLRWFAMGLLAHQAALSFFSLYPFVGAVEGSSSEEPHQITVVSKKMVYWGWFAPFSGTGEIPHKTVRLLPYINQHFSVQGKSLTPRYTDFWLML